MIQTDMSSFTLNFSSLKYHISLNDSWGRLFLFPLQKGVIIRGRQLFQILLTGSHALNILFYYSSESKKIITSNKPNMGFLSVPNLVN